MKRISLLIFLYLATVGNIFVAIEARRTGGIGGGRKSSSSSSGFGSLFGGSKKTNTNPNPQSSYPKQTWSQPGAAGTGTGVGAGGSYPKQTWSQSGGTGTNYGQVSGGGSNFGVGNKQGAGAGTYLGGSNNYGGVGNRPAGTNYGGTNYGGTNYGSNQGGTNYGGTNYGGTNYGGTNYGGNYYGNRQGSFGGGGSSSIGGGGFVNPNRGFSNPNVGRSYGYYGAGGQSIFGSSAGSYNYHRSPFGGFSGSRGLAVGAGAGFIGGAVAGMAAVSMYHQYRQFQSLMYCSSNPGYCGSGYGYGHYGYGGRRILVNAEDCVGGCPNQAYCDYGICRCRDGYEARYGSCFKSLDEYSTRQSDWDSRTKSNYNPYHGCSQHRDCRDVDMNMVCTANKCACRKNMKWNDEVYECQIFVDVDCSDVNVNSTTTTTTNSNVNSQPIASALTDASNSTFAEYEYEHNNETMTDEVDAGNSTVDPDLDPNSPFNKLVNVTSLTANETLADSELTKINPNTTSPQEIKAAFCREVARTARIYAPPPDRVTINRSPPPNNGIGYGGSVAIVIVVIIVIAGGLFVLVKMCKKKAGRNKETYDFNEDAGQPMGMGTIQQQPPNQMAFSGLQNEPPPYSTQDQGGYPTLAIPYPPGPDAPNQGPYMPPGQQPYAPYPGQGGPAAPYPPAGQMPYPPTQAPYPPGPGNPYPPAGPPYPGYN